MPRGARGHAGVVANRILLFATFLLATTPGTAADDTGNRAGKDVVASVCSACHQAGLNGAPKIGDREAWIPRMKRGLNELALSAIRGHGGMPARGGQAALTDLEIRNAIVYMWDPEAEARAAARPAPPPQRARGPNDAVVNGIEVNFGLVPAERLRAYPWDSPERLMHGGVPSGTGSYHVNVTLFDAGNHKAISEAAVEVLVTQAGNATQKIPLEHVRSLNPASYGQYVKLLPKTPTTFSVLIRQAGSERVSEARFTPIPE